MVIKYDKLASKLLKMALYQLNLKPSLYYIMHGQHGSQNTFAHNKQTLFKFKSDHSKHSNPVLKSDPARTDK
jgi:hypothetical protein